MPRFYSTQDKETDLTGMIEESSKPEELPEMHIYTITLILIFMWFFVGLVSNGIIVDVLMVIILLLLLKGR